MSSFRRPHLVGIAGPSGAGKTKLAFHLGSRLAAPVISLDSYYRDLSHLPQKERTHINFDVPEAIDHDLLVRQVAELANGLEIEKPIYDFTRHVRTAAREKVRAGEFAIVEGLFTLYWEDIRDLFGTRVFVTSADSVCLERRLARDTHERGRSPASVIEQYERTVRPSAQRYVLPSSRFADVIVSGADVTERSAATVLREIQLRCHA